MIHKYLIVALVLVIFFQQNIFIDYLEVLHYVDQSHSLPNLFRSAPTLMLFPQQKRIEKKTQVQFVLPIYSLEHGQTSVVSPLKKTESFLTHTPTRSHQL